MRDLKKTGGADLERRRGEMFLVALVLILSAVYCALEWNSALVPAGDEASIEDIMEDIDFDKLKKDLDMVAAENEPETPEDAAGITVNVGENLETDEAPQAGDSAESGDESDGDDTEKEKTEQLLSTVLSENENLLVMERLPEFPGGASAFMKWITANLKYPRAARERKIQGRVVVSFVVDAEGNTTKLKLESAEDRQLGNAVMGVMARMPKWKPGVQDGKICATMIKVPINFEL